MFYNPIRRHGNNGNLSPVEFEKNYDINKKRVYKTRGDSVQISSSNKHQKTLTFHKYLYNKLKYKLVNLKLV